MSLGYFTTETRYPDGAVVTTNSVRYSAQAQRARMAREIFERDPFQRAESWWALTFALSKED